MFEVARDALISGNLIESAPNARRKINSEGKSISFLG